MTDSRGLAATATELYVADDANNGAVCGAVRVYSCADGMFLRIIHVGEIGRLAVFEDGLVMLPHDAKAWTMRLDGSRKHELPSSPPWPDHVAVADDRLFVVGCDSNGSSVVQWPWPVAFRSFASQFTE